MKDRNMQGQEIRNKQFGGERPLFESHHLVLDNITVTDGESAIKECSDIIVRNSHFIGKYPLWHVHGFEVSDTHFAVEARSALWYSDNLKMRNTVIDAPKMFREMHNLDLADVTINDADETFWRCKDIVISNVKLHDGTYPFMFSENIKVDHLTTDSKYVFQYVKNVEIHNSDIVTRDAFWETENVTIYDSFIDSEFLGWHSRNLRFVRCRIAGTQPFCYIDNLILEDCTLDSSCDLAFEYSHVHADIKGHVPSIKNPCSGEIVADSIGEIIIDKNIKAPANCDIRSRRA